MSKQFVLSDSTTLNTYGFYVDVASLDLGRFLSNPVMLLDHKNSVESIAGKWTDLVIAEGQLKGTPEFDENDEVALKAKSKVDGGYLKGASIGLNIIDGVTVFERAPDGRFVLKHAELCEASLCAVPSDKKALRLYNGSTGEELSTKDIELKLSLKTQNVNTNTMKKIMLSAMALTALGLTHSAEGLDVDVVEKAIGDLSKSNQELKAENLKLTAEKEQAESEKAESLIDGAIKEGKLSATQKEEWLSLAKANYQLASSTIAGIPAKQSLSAGVANPESKNEGADLPKTKEDFQKLSHSAQLSFKKDHPSEYAQLFARK